MVTPLRVHNIHKSFGPHPVLKGLNLEVDAGELVVLLGPNGVGKSTLLGCICGTVVPDQGTIAIGGHALQQQPLLARGALRYLPQEVEVPPGLTGTEVLEFLADVHGDREGVVQAAEFSRLGEALQRLATTYSVGMRRRLAFAGLLPGKAALYVLDEPFAGVDREARIRMRTLLGELCKSGAGIVVAAHDQDLEDLDGLGARRFDLTSHLTAQESA